MAYEVTATRRRPQDFDSLVGQEFVASTLKNAIQSGKIAHAYLFSGPRGCGKTSSARILAKALNCQHGPNAQPCGQCSICQEITRGASMDVIEIDGASNTSVNDIRQIKDEVLFPPNSCRYKIYIIDEVHMLSNSAFNALLKTIEEPPPYVIFIFATTELHKVPATIKSRCQQFHFRLVAVEQLKELLAQAAAEIGLQAEDEALYWIAREATGSVRDAYTLFDQVASFSSGHITFEKIRETLGLVGLDTMNHLFETCVASNTSATLEQLDSLLQSGVSIEQFISDCSDYLRSLLLIKAGITKESLLGQSLGRYSQQVLTGWSVPQTERALSLFLNLYRDIRYSTSPRYEVDLAISRLCGLSFFVSPQEVLHAVEQARQLLSGGVSPSPRQGVSHGQTAPQRQWMSQEQPMSQGQPMPTASSERQPSPFASGGAVPPEHRHPPNNLGGSMISRPKPVVTPAVPTQKTGVPVTPIVEDVRVAAVKPVENPSRLIPEADERQRIVAENPVPEKQQSLVSGAVVPRDKLREKLVEELSISRASTASALLGSEPWQFVENKIVITVLTSFALNQLQRDKLLLSQMASSLSGEDLQIEFQLKRTVEANKIEVQSNQVDIICKVFKGTVVGDV